MIRTITVMTMLFMLIGTGFVFAEGQQEDRQPSYGWGGRYAEGDFGKKVEVTGPLSFDEYHFPEITSGGKTYQLMIPRFYYDDVDVGEGDSLTVEGYTVPGPRFEETEENQVHVHVTKAVIDGEEYTLDRTAWAGHMGRGGFRGGPGMGGPRGGFRGGPGMGGPRGGGQYGGPRGGGPGYGGYGHHGPGYGPCW